jgi:hypothetical protein
MTNYKKQVTRIIGVWRYTSCRQISKDLNVLPLPYIYISEIIQYIKLYIEKLEQNSTIRNMAYNKTNRTNAFKKGDMRMGVKLQSKLLNKCREVEEIMYFKREMRAYPLQCIFYSVDEHISY